MLRSGLLASRGGGEGGGELHLIEVSEVVRQPERPDEERLDRVWLRPSVVDGVLEAVAVLPYYRLAPPDFFGRNASQDVERPERAVHSKYCDTTWERGSRNIMLDVPLLRVGHHSLLQKVRPLLFNSSRNRYLNESPPVFGMW